MLSEADTLPINGHRHMLVLVGIDSDHHIEGMTTLLADDSSHTCLLRDGVPARQADKTAMGLETRLLLGHCSPRPLALNEPSRDRVDRSSRRHLSQPH